MTEQIDINDLIEYYESIIGALHTEIAVLQARLKEYENE